MKDKKPHDCDSLKAPIGDKECHYEIRVQVVEASPGTPGTPAVRSGTDPVTGKPIVTLDFGKTWAPNDLPIYFRTSIDPSTRKPIVTFDDGKKWVPNDLGPSREPTKPEVSYLGKGFRRLADDLTPVRRHC